MLFRIPDNNRYRFMVDPLMMALLAVAAIALAGPLRRLAPLPRRLRQSTPRPSIVAELDYSFPGRFLARTVIVSPR